MRLNLEIFIIPVLDEMHDNQGIVCDHVFLYLQS